MKGNELCYRLFTMNEMGSTETLDQNINLRNSDRSSEPIFNITPFNNNQGLYYEAEGRVKLTSKSWELVTYINLQLHISEYQTIMSQYNATVQICNNSIILGNLELYRVCDMFVQQFTQMTLKYFYEIESNYRNLMLVIGYNHHDRARRGLKDTFGRMANVLYGICSKIDTKFLVDKIIELGASKLESLNLINERKRILKIESAAENHVSKQITEKLQKVEQNFNHLQQQMVEYTQNIDKTAFKTKLLEQAILIEMILNKYCYETQNLITIINSALNGKVHTNVLSSQQLLKELREVKMTLPVGSALPVELKTETLTDLFRISEISIFIQDNHLVYVINIPLISNAEYNVYRPIPLPIQFNSDTLALIDTEIDYLAVSIDNEKFLSLTKENWAECKPLKQEKLCKSSQPVHLRLESQPCEVSLLNSQPTFPENCNLKFLKIDKAIWHKLSESNSWLYFTQSKSGTITCSDPSEHFNFELSGVGRLTISPQCEIHIDQSIIEPLHQITRDIKLDVIPENLNPNLKTILSEISTKILPQNIKYETFITDWNNVAHKAIEFKKIPHVHSETLLGIKIYQIVISMSMIILFSIISFCTIVRKLRKNQIIMYNPDIPDIVVEGIEEGNSS